jgi:two-component system, cell cycle sensor histidine kinase PleC
MARLHAANASLRASRSMGAGAPVPNERYGAMIRHERLIRNAIPFLLLLFMGSVLYSAVQQISASREEAMQSTEQRLKQSAALRAAIMRAEKWDGAASTLPDIGASDAAVAHFVIADKNGAIVSSSFPQPWGTLAELLPGFAFRTDQGPVLQPMTFADGRTALVHALPYGEEGAIITLGMLDDALAAWRAKSFALGVLLATSLIALVTLGLAYYLQAARAGDADTICATLSERMQLALTRGRCGIWDWDLRTGSIEWSSSMYELLGLAPREGAITYEEVNALLHADDRSSFGAAQGAIRDGATLDDLEFRMQHAEGRWIWLRARADVVSDGARHHLVGFAIDITEQKRLDVERRQADLRLLDAIESVPEAFVLWDSENRLVVCNRNYTEFHQLDDDAAIRGVAYADLHAKSRLPDATRLEPLSVMADHNQTYEAELSDGRWLQVSERRTKDGGYVSVGTDVTSRKQQEQRLLKLIDEQARHKGELERRTQKVSELARRYREQYQLAQSANQAKSAFLANMSHELRTPLNAVIGFAQIMEQRIYGPLGSPRYDDYMSDIRSSGEYLLGIVNDLLNMSEIEAGKIRLNCETTDLVGPIAMAAAAVRPQAAARNIRIDLPETTGRLLRIDKNAAAQIFSHLIGNAVKFNRNGGTVRIRVSPAARSFNIYVTDNGVGMPPEALAALGKPFAQPSGKLHNGMKGSGLGLAIARSLIEMHGGTLRIRSKLGKGTVVMVNLPDGLLTDDDASLASREDGTDQPLE